MKKSFLVAAIICISLIGLSASFKPTQTPASFLPIRSFSSLNASPADTFKNLKILPKNIAPGDLDSIMKGFTKAMNVDCGFCHTKSVRTGEWNYASDRRHEKEEAREMMTMTYALNKKYFNHNDKKKKIQTVTCITCHNGKVHPDRVQW